MRWWRYVLLPVRVVVTLPLAIVLSAMAAWKALRKPSDEEHPAWTRSGPRIRELTELAFRLAAAGREDMNAVEQLRALAGGRRRNLRYAAAAVRSQAWVGENLGVFRANELLLAATNGISPRPVTEEQLASFRRLEELTNLRRSRAFARLAELCPALADVPGMVDAEPYLDEYRRIEQALARLVGPDAETDDELLRSHAVYDIAFEHLIHPEKEKTVLPAIAGTLAGHAGAVSAMDLTVLDDRPALYIAGAEHTVRVWDLAVPEVRHTLTGHTGPVCAISRALVMDLRLGGERMASDKWGAVVARRADATARIWQEDTGELRHVLTGHTGPVVAVDCGHVKGEPITMGGMKYLRPALSIVPWDSVAVTASTDGTARVWRIDTGALMHTLVGHDGPLTDVGTSFAGLGSMAITSGVDGTARVWELATGAQLHVLAGHDGPVNALWYTAFGAQGRIALTGGADGRALLWNMNTGARIATLTADAGSLVAVRLVLNPRWTALAATDQGTALVWDLKTGAPRHTLTGHVGPLTAIDKLTIEDREFVITAGTDGTVRLWDMETGAPQATLTSHDGPVTAMCWQPIADRTIVTTGGSDGAVVVHDLSAIVPPA